MKNSSVPQVKEIFSTYSGQPLEVTLCGTDVMILDVGDEVDAETYDEEGIWLCEIIEAVKGNHPKFHQLFKPGGLIDIVEREVTLIKNKKNNEILYKKT